MIHLIHLNLGITALDCVYQVNYKIKIIENVKKIINRQKMIYL